MQVLLVLVCAAAVTAPAEALVRTHENGQPIAFDISDGLLADSLVEFGERAGVMIIFDHDLVDGHRAPSLSGQFTAPAALTRLLHGTPLAYRKISHDTWAIILTGEEEPLVTALSRPSTILSATPERKLRDEIVVTASFRPPAPLAGQRALYTVDSEQLRMQGALNVSEPIFELPATVASVTSANTALFLSVAGLNLADLRGLGPTRTQVLVNGRRFVRTIGGDNSIIGVDLNSIPAPFVERIEIVNQGAGAAIGGDAVAGAINIVTREEIDGVAFTADGSVSEMGDAEDYAFSILAGKSFWDERARLTAGVTYAQEPSLLVQERPRLTNPFGFQVNGRRSNSPDAMFTPGFGGSTFTPNGSLAGAVTQAGDVVFSGSRLERQAFSSDGAMFQPFVGQLDQLYDWTTDFAALPEIERLIGYAHGTFELSDNHQIYGEAHLASTDVKTQIASSPVSVRRGLSSAFGDGIFVPANNPFIPAGLLTFVENSVGGPVNGLLLERRFIELGPRTRDIDRDTVQVLAGIEGQISGDWRYDVSFQYGSAKTRDEAAGIASRDKLAIALDINRCALTLGCTPINIFGSTNITQAQAQFILASPRLREFAFREHLAQAKVSGPIFSNSGVDGFATAGIDYRREGLNDEPINYQAQDGALGEFQFPGADGSVSYFEPFATVTAPILVDAPFARLLEAGGAVRMIAKNDGSDFVNISGNVRWSPIEGVNLFTSVFHGGRAPNAVELFSRGAEIEFPFFDPCAFNGGDPVIIQNCLSGGALGTPAGFTQTRSLTRLRETGNPDLSEERINSQVYGIVADFHALFPDFPGSLTLSADWRNYKVDDLISLTHDVENAFDCYASPSLSSFLCGDNPATGAPFIQRDPLTRQIVSIDNGLVNQGFLQTNGLDARLQYFTDVAAAGPLEFFSVDILYTYINKARTSRGYEQKEERQEGLVSHPRHQIHATASIGADALKTVWTFRRRGSALSTRASDRAEAHIPPVIYIDAALQARPTDNTVVYLGIENLFDKQPPIVAFANGNTFYEYYDIIGRRFFAGVKAEF